MEQIVPWVFAAFFALPALGPTVFFVSVLCNVLSSRDSIKARATGKVVGANVEFYTSQRRDAIQSFRSELVETVEITTRNGRLIRGHPVKSDIDALDREGIEVATLYDRAWPERFIGPLDGQRITFFRYIVRLAVLAILALTFASVALFIFGQSAVDA